MEQDSPEKPCNVIEKPDSEVAPEKNQSGLGSKKSPSEGSKKSFEPEERKLRLRSDDLDSDQLDEDEPEAIDGAKSPKRTHSVERSPRRSTIKEKFKNRGMSSRYSEMEKLFRNNINWAKSKINQDPNYFLRLKDIQQPQFLWIGCADSRVPANEIIGLEPGEVFVHRNIANLVLASDLSLISCVEFAVNYLKVKHIIVCGHYGCSGIKYAYQCADVGLLNPWLTSIKENYRHNRKEIEEMATEEAKLKKFAEYNVIEGCMSLMKMHTIQRSFAMNKYPVIHACIYDISNGRLVNLDIDFIDRMAGYGSVFSFGFGEDGKQTKG